MLSLDQYRIFAWFSGPPRTNEGETDMWGMESNVVFASVRYNWKLSRDGFIVYGGARRATPFFGGSIIDLSKY